MNQFKVIRGDALQEMKNLPDRSFDAVICDPPYATTNCAWDKTLDWAAIWPELWRLCKTDASPVILFSQQPFTTDLICSQRGFYRYDLVWDKQVSGNPFTANVRPLPVHETILVFGRSGGTYNPQKVKGAANHTRKTTERKGNEVFQAKLRDVESDTSGNKFPTSILRFPKHTSREKDHPMQKPLALMEWLIRTYTNEGDTILDFTCGSGSTLEAAVNLKRNVVGIEQDILFSSIALSRCEAETGKFAPREFDGIFAGVTP